VNNHHRHRPAEILLVEDNPGDVLLVSRVLRDLGRKTNLRVATDGLEAMAFLFRTGPEARKPDLIMLDWNLAGKHGRELLAEIKSADVLKMIPVIVFTSSQADRDVQQAYALQANCYVTKPTDLDEFKNLVRGLMDLWLSAAILPTRSGSA
jgi:two-component system, chemotaxis family, response regulator Rcp1